MIPLVITLVITAVISGRDFERHERMGSVAECWITAQSRLEDMRLGRVFGH